MYSDTDIINGSQTTSYANITMFPLAFDRQNKNIVKWDHLMSNYKLKSRHNSAKTLLELFWIKFDQQENREAKICHWIVLIN